MQGANMAKFTLATLATPDGPKAAIGVGEKYYLLSAVQPLLSGATCKTILQSWDTSLPLLEALADKLSDGSKTHAADIAARTATLLTPIMYPDGLFAVGANYSGHLKEMGLDTKKWASMPFFIRPPKTTLVGPGQTVIVPKTTKQFDWECELAVFVGKTLRNASKEEAASAVAGYAIGLDLSCRDLIQVNNDLKVDLVRGKAQDTMAPCGPFIMPAKFVTDVNNLRIQLFVNDQKMMDASTCEMLYKLDEQLSVISEFMTIQAGDILFTGSPAGSAAEHGGCWLKAGDRIHAEIEQVGVLDVIMREQ
jgi:2,4-didehydro-3-deoxy-L-rhamnonate hydrolase